MNADQRWEPDSVRSIAVLRPNALGDFIFCLPALYALRQRYSAARITYVGQAWHADFLRGRPGPIDEVVVMPPYPGVGAHAPAGGIDGANELDTFIAHMRERRFDLALQLYGGGRHANPLLRRFGARCCVGMQASDAEPLDRNLHYGGAVNKRLQLLEVAALAGASAWPLRAQLQVTAHDRQQAARGLPPQAGENLVLLQPGASDPRRCWPAHHFARLGDALAERGMQLLINGAASEASLVQSIIAAMRYPALDLSGKTSLHALCGLLDRCALVVSNDTGPLHLALEIGVPAVGVYWFTNLIESAPLRQDAHRAAVSLQIQCPACGAENLAQRCPHDVSFVDSVSVDEVLDHALDLLDPQRARNKARA